METFITIQDGKFIGVVRSGKVVVYKSAAYVTENMAAADARCWMAFHGEEEPKIVNPGERFAARTKTRAGMRTVEYSAEHVEAQIAEYAKHGIPAVRRQGATGEYVEIGRDGCSYARYMVI